MALAKKGAKAADAARALGLTRTTTSRWAAGEYMPRGPLAARLAEWLGVKLEWLLPTEPVTSAPRSGPASRVTKAQVPLPSPKEKPKKEEMQRQCELAGRAVASAIAKELEEREVYGPGLVETMRELADVLESAGYDRLAERLQSEIRKVERTLRQKGDR